MTLVVTPHPRGTPAERWLPLAGFALLAGGGLLLVAGLERFVPPCVFLELTGAYCPGCGSGRVIMALARGDLAAAVRANVLVVAALPFVIVGLAHETAVAWGLLEASRRRVDHRWLWALAAVITVFWVLRNMPVMPFSLLAPG